MRAFQVTFSLALLSQSAVVVSFQTIPRTVARCSRMSMLGKETQYNNQAGEDTGKLIIPYNRKRGLISKLTTFQLSALKELKKDETKRFNKQQLIKMGITTAAFLTTLTKSTIARAATSLVMKQGSVTPLISSPGFGLVEMPGARGVTSFPAGLPNQGAMFFALALFITTALLRSAGDGYASMVHMMFKHFVQGTDVKEEIELGLPVETDWNAYSHDLLDPLQKKAVEGEKSSKYEVDKRTMLFEPTKMELEG